MQTNNASLTPITLRPIGVIRSPHTVAEKTPIQPVFAANARGTAELQLEYEEGLADLEGFTAALLLMHDVAYRDLQQQEVELTGPDVENVAQCIEYRLPMLTRDIGWGHDLRDRLADFVGLRIGCVSTSDTNDCQRPT